MFTGIITDIGTVSAIEKSGDWRLRIATAYPVESIALGASIACNGVCLTVVAVRPGHFEVQVSGETRARTTIDRWHPGTRLNLERALKVGDELGGHFVTGHVDGLAELVATEKVGDSWKLRWAAPQTLAYGIAAKGSVALDGVSLTVNAVEGRMFEVNLIPHSWEHTTLSAVKVGEAAHLEIDLLARYLSRMREVEGISW